MKRVFTIPAKSASCLIAAFLVAGVAKSEVIFEDDFDNQPDYTSSSALSLPGWTHRRNGEDVWSPSTGFPLNHDAFEVLAANSDKARGGTGKAFVGWRESYDMGWKNFNSDGILAKHLGEGYDQLYVSFWVRFSSEWTKDGLTKLFRVYSWDSDAGEIFKFFSDGNSGPIMLWDYSHNEYGIRNTIALRGGPHGDYYAFSNDDIAGLPRNMHGLGGLSLNYTADTVGMGFNGTTPKIVDRVNGGYISDNLNQTVDHEQIFGKLEEGEWTKLSFFVKMNSFPNATDGSLMQWINDELVFQNHNIPWVRGDETTDMVRWNVVAIGGNDFFRAYENALLYEEWYAIDDVEIHDSIPTAPLPPTGVTLSAQ